MCHSSYNPKWWNSMKQSTTVITCKVGIRWVRHVADRQHTFTSVCLCVTRCTDAQTSSSQRYDRLATDGRTDGYNQRLAPATCSHELKERCVYTEEVPSDEISQTTYWVNDIASEERNLRSCTEVLIELGSSASSESLISFLFSKHLRKKYRLFEQQPSWSCKRSLFRPRV